MKWLAIVFCIFTAIAAFGIGNTVQANSIALIVSETYSVPTYLTGILLSIATALVILFGVKGIAKFAEHWFRLWHSFILWVVCSSFILMLRS